ncbi:MAG: adenine phosphoribosyltransferase [Anaerolineales bacterium]|nr:MAG: adenine phosphoribosyltransferase [Anaerolineales bacterium]
MELASLIRDVPDYPIEGILFKDITTLIQNADAFQEVIDWMVELYADISVDCVVAIEARGYIFGAPLAYRLGAGFVPVRKPGKLPAKTISESYALEYGTNTLEMHEDAIKPGQQVLVIDDLLATGGSARAAVNLVERLGGEVAGVAFMIELDFLHGRDKLEGYAVQSLIHFD